MSSSDLNQVGKNLGLNIASFLCNLVIGLWLVPYLITHLGIAAYGVVPLAMVFTEYVSIITQSFNVVVSRFLTIELRGVKKTCAGNVFNTSLALMVALSFLQIFLATLVLCNFSKLIAVPEGFFLQGVWLFALTFIGFIFSMLGGVFNVSMYSLNRLDLLRFNDIGRLAVRTIVVILLFNLYEPNLISVGVGNLLGGVVALLLSVIQWRKLTPELGVNFRQVQFERLKPIANMAGWVIINSIGYILFLRIDIYIVNQMIGPAAGGEYAAVLQWSYLVRIAAGVFSGVITPLGMIYYAQGNLQKLARMMAMAVKFMGLLFALPLALLCVFASDILFYWLGESFRSLGGLMVLQLCTLVFNLAVLPLFSINVATNRVKIPAILTLAMGALNFVLAIWFVEQFELGVYGVALAGLIALTLKNTIFTPWYAAHLLNVRHSMFYTSLFHGVVAFCFFYAVSFCIRNLVHSESLLAIGTTIILIFSVSVLPLVWCGLSKGERLFISDIVPLKLRKGCKKLLLVS